jgi:hypothetical protein
MGSENLIQQSPSKVCEQDLIVFGEHLCRDFCLTFVNWAHGLGPVFVLYHNQIGLEFSGHPWVMYLLILSTNKLL